MMFGYSVQIFADFAGYSLIAIGVASLFGYRLPQNFDFPYLSRTFAEFWKRWHMTLGLWLKEYLYIPLGGNRKGELRTYINLMVVMILGGLWHGASVNYLLWGAFHGLLLTGERFFSRFFVLPRSGIVTLLQMLLVFSLVTFGWLFFLLDWQGFLGFSHAIIHNTHINHNRGVLLMVFFYSLPVLAYYANHIVGEKNSLYKKRVERLSPYIYGLMLFVIIFQSGNANAFIYFQF
jgi:alginate O-acetyltransferase complex protein AlgI